MLKQFKILCSKPYKVLDVNCETAKILSFYRSVALNEVFNIEQKSWALQCDWGSPIEPDRQLTKLIHNAAENGRFGNMIPYSGAQRKVRIGQ